MLTPARMLFIAISFLSFATADAGANRQFNYGLTNRELYREIRQGDDSTFESTRSSFIRPNERNPEYLPPILDELVEGGLLIVGTERGFMTAAMLPEITHVFFVDRVPEVVLYNRLNIELLKIARSHRDYVYLRTKASVTELALRFLTSARNPTRKPTLGQLNWFVRVLRHRDGADKLTTVQSALVSGTDQKAPPTLSEEANYVLNRELGEHLMRLAKEGRMDAYLLDLDDMVAVESFRDNEMKPRLDGAPLALIDVSNAWWSEYMGERRFGRLLKTLTTKDAPTLAVGTSLSESGWFYLALAARNAHAPTRWLTIEHALNQADLKKLSDAKRQREFSDSLSTTYQNLIRVSANATATCENLFLPAGHL